MGFGHDSEQQQQQQQVSVPQRKGHLFEPDAAELEQMCINPKGYKSVC